MSRSTRPTASQYRLPPVHHGEEDESTSMGLEDSLQRHTLPGTNLFARPPISQGPTSYGFAATPDVLPQGWSLRGASSLETPEAGPSIAPAFGLPPRIERMVGRAGPPSFGANVVRPGGMNLFSRPAAGAGAGAGVTSALESSFDDASSSMSQSFSFAPRNGSGGMRAGMLSMPPQALQQPSLQTGREPLPPFAAPHTPIRPARATTATTSLFADPIAATPANLDMAALAAERRIREQRAVSRTSAEQMLSGSAPRRSVSFSTTTTSTPANHGAGSVTPDNMPNVARMMPAPPNRAAAIAATRTAAIDASMSHLGRAPRLAGPAYGDLSISMSSSTSDTSMLTRPTATRLFHTSQPSTHSTWTTPPQPPSASALHASEPQEHSTASSSSYMFDPSSSSSSSPHTVERKVATVRLRKWDGSQLSVPTYLVEAVESAERAVEEMFGLDTVDRFDVRVLVGGYEEAVLGRTSASEVGRGGEVGKGTGCKVEGQQEDEQGEDAVEDVDALKAILEIQLGLRGMHGWYGHTFHNPKHPRPSPSISALNNPVAQTDGRTSRKRRRCDSSTSSTGSSPSPALRPRRDEQAEESTSPTPEDDEPTPIIIYDTFGRVRGTVTLPDYTRRGGPPFPLPNPRETFALRYASASQALLNHTSLLSNKEDLLCSQIDLVNSRWKALQSNPPTSPSTSSTLKEGNTGEGGKSTIRSDRFYTELKSKTKALKLFRSSYRNGLLKALQNALVDSTVVPRR